MRKRVLYLTGLLLAGLAMLGCNPYPPSAPSSTTINQNVNVNLGTPGASPSPSAGGAIARVGIGKVSETGCANPSGRGDAVRVGCEAFLTCSPFSASGQEIFDPAIIGAAPDSFQAVSGQDNATFIQRQSNAFNADARGVKVGPLVVQCIVRGVASAPFTLSVVQ